MAKQVGRATNQFLVVITLALASSVNAAEDMPARINRIVSDVLADGPTAGAAVKVVRKGEVVVDKAWGKADVELDVAMTSANLFRIGSITKQFTAAAILRLVEKGRLKLDDDVARLLPEAPLHGKKITIAQLLTHTSGLHNFTELRESHGPLPMTSARLYELIKDQTFDFEPGQAWHYSNTGYYLLGLIIEKVSGKKYRDFLRDEVTARAGLQHTIYCDEGPIVRGRVRGYRPVGRKLENAAPIDMSTPFSAGALCSTVGDLVQWSQALAGGRVVSAASYAKMTTPVKVANGPDPGYGFGLAVPTTDKHRVVTHNGGINGFNSLLIHFPDDGVTIAVLANTEDGIADQIGKRIADAMLDLPSLRPPPLAIVPLLDPARFVGVFDTKFKEETHRLHAYADSGHLWLSDDFDGSDDRLDYLGGNEFVVHNRPFHVTITTDGLKMIGPIPGEMSGPRVKQTK